jgi:hypothetical protein
MDYTESLCSPEYDSGRKMIKTVENRMGTQRVIWVLAKLLYVISASRSINI